MTDGEKMIWAAVFARTYDEIENPPECLSGKIGRPGFVSKSEYEKGVISEGVEIACYAVQHAREAVDEAREGHGEKSDVVEMLKAMVEVSNE